MLAFTQQLAEQRTHANLVSSYIPVVGTLGKRDTRGVLIATYSMRVSGPYSPPLPLPPTPNPHSFPVRLHSSVRRTFDFTGAHEKRFLECHFRHGVSISSMEIFITRREKRLAFVQKCDLFGSGANNFTSASNIGLKAIRILRERRGRKCKLFSQNLPLRNSRFVQDISKCTTLLQMQYCLNNLNYKLQISNV